MASTLKTFKRLHLYEFDVRKNVREMTSRRIWDEVLCLDAEFARIGERYLQYSCKVTSSGLNLIDLFRNNEIKRLIFGRISGEIPCFSITETHKARATHATHSECQHKHASIFFYRKKEPSHSDLLLCLLALSQKRVPTLRLVRSSWCFAAAGTASAREVSEHTSHCAVELLHRAVVKAIRAVRADRTYGDHDRDTERDTDGFDSILPRGRSWLNRNHEFLSTIRKVVVSRIREIIRSRRLADLEWCRIKVCRCEIQFSTVQWVVLLIRISVLEVLTTCSLGLQVIRRALRRIGLGHLGVEESHVLRSNRVLLIHLSHRSVQSVRGEHGANVWRERERERVE